MNGSGSELGIVVEQADEATEEIVSSMAALMPQLSSSAAPLGASEVAELIACEAVTQLVARSDGRIVGFLTLVTFPIPPGVRAWIEDVVVDWTARRSGVGAALVGRAVEIAGSKGARTVDLTSRPSREAANRLYERLGFELRETNVYRIDVATTD
ncbi:MAG TPA: GNAT family N-acetyltransferase [Acidimicrobiales bacterium]|nr:GNAT family N-acetyltransferase [Acidimicrobiales bacterium]